jgi:hypothetical protein
MKIFPGTFIIIFFLFAIILKAQEASKEIETDRPDMTESGVVVPLGVFQFEDGFVLENQKTTLNDINNSTHNYTFSSLLTRIGILNNFELRIGGDYLYQATMTNNIQSNNSGFTNLLVGAKYQLMKEEINGQDFGLIMQFYLPSGNKSFGSKNIEPEILIAAGKSLTDIISISVNIGSHWNSQENQPAYLYSSSIGFSINESLDSFIELYGEASKRIQLKNNFDFGFAFRPINYFQIDVSAGNESFSDFNNWFVGAGISFKIPR